MLLCRRSTLVVLLVAILLSGLTAPSVLQAQDNPLCFNVPGINNCIDGRFLEFWTENGGLPVFGYPITASASESTADGTFLAQYFERNRFELHPEKALPYDVLLGRLGAERLRQQGRDWRTFPKAQMNTPHFFTETGHAIPHDPFWRYWSSHGLEFDGVAGISYSESLALFGLPLSEASIETNSSGDTVLTQWFERARFEDHGERGVLLGLLGNETHRSGALPTLPPEQSGQTMTFFPSADAFVHKDFPDTNFGSDGLLAADVEPYRESYIRFELSGIERPIVSAKLMFYVTTLPAVEGGSTSGGILKQMSNSNWSESNVTYNTRPTINGPILDTQGPVRPGEWYDFDITQAITGNGTVSLGLITDHSDGVYITSREVTPTAPRLVLTLAR